MRTRTATTYNVREQLDLNHRTVIAADTAAHSEALLTRAWERRGPLARLRRREHPAS
jgi:hypothetical protein